ncbi:hypothetical protein OSTOST_21852 [Ostertagia ostertagi]
MQVCVLGLGAYTSVKTLQNSNYALAFGWGWRHVCGTRFFILRTLFTVVNALFYELNMDLITFYYYVLEQAGVYKGSQRNFENELKDMAMNRAQRNHLSNRLKGVRVKTDKAIVYDRNGRVSMSERHGKFEKVLDCPPTRYKMNDGKFMAEVYHHCRWPLR